MPSPYLPLKLSAIEQQHLQELYDAAGVPRDALPYTEAIEQMCRDFQDRAFKNAGPGQVYGALVKYIKSSACPKTAPVEVTDDEPNAAAMKKVKEHRAGKAKILPYTTEFDSARREFTAFSKVELSELDFYRGLRLAGERPPAKSRRAVAVAAPVDAVAVDAETEAAEEEAAQPA